MKSDDERQAAIEYQARMKARVVCICKGITLGKVLPALDGAETVADVNRGAGTGSGGCQGDRCGPRIKALIAKKQQTKKKDAKKKQTKKKQTKR